MEANSSILGFWFLVLGSRISRFTACPFWGRLSRAKPWRERPRLGPSGMDPHAFGYRLRAPLAIYQHERSHSPSKRALKHLQRM